MIAGLTVAAILPAQPAQASTVGGSFVALTPSRLLDTRTANGGHDRIVKPNEVVTLAVAGRGGVPGSGAGAVIVNVTATGATASGVVTVYPGDQSAPTASNLNYVAGSTVPNLVVAKLSPAGQVKLYNHASGSVHLVVDVSGYYRSGAASAEGTFTPLAPARLLDTRTTTGGHHGAVKAHETVPLTALGHAGLPASGVSAVAVNVTVTGPTGSGVITAYPDGSPRPTASNLNFSTGQTVANLVDVRVGSGGRVDLYNNSAGTVNLVVDVAGYFRAGAPLVSGAFGALAPARLLDTRTATGGHHSVVGPGQRLDLDVTGHGGVPTSGVAAVVLNVTVTGPTRSGVITVYPAGGAVPTASNLNYRTGQTVPNLVVAGVGSGGRVSIVNTSAGSVNLLADVAGYYLSSDLPLPSTSPGRYVRNLHGSSTDASTMADEGCTDAKQITNTAAHTVVLDIGAQTVRDLNGARGVLLSATDTRLTDAQLVTALNGYLSGFAGCRVAGASGSVTVAVATNSDGDFSPTYDAPTKGQDWAANVIDKIQIPAGSALGVVGANDVEAGFAATEAQVEQWEHAYLAATAKKLLLIGSADGCPGTLGTTGATCASVATGNDSNPSNTWTQHQYYRIAHGLNPGRLQVLPQLYYAVQAIQWANIDRTDASSSDKIAFIGALTEHAADPDTATPAQGWALLSQALSNDDLTDATPLPVVVDLSRS